MKAKVWFVPLAQKEKPASISRKAVELADLAGLANMVRKNGFIGILQHVGERNNTGYIKPHVTKSIAKLILEYQAKPFLTGSSTLYRGRRSNAHDHLMQAYDHGFTPAAIKCPVIMCDGLCGADWIGITVPNAKHCRTAFLGSAVALMDGLVVVTHPTGHIAAGFAAALKNISMGLASRGGKLAMHHGGYPAFAPESCTGCGRCAHWCPENAISINEKAELNADKCIGCGQCLSVCSSDAIDFKWNVSGLRFQEQVVEYCAAVKSQLDNRILCLNIIQRFQKGCDCLGTPQKALCPDIGIVASRDPVAIDMATADLLKRSTGKDIVLKAGERDYRRMLTYAEKLGVGSREYELIE